MEQIKLGEVIELISGRDLTKTEYNDSRLGIPYIMGASNMSNGHLQIERWTDKPSVIGMKDDIVISVKGTVGELLILNEAEVHLSRQVMAIRVKKCVQKEYVLYYLKFYLDKIKEKAKGMIPGITREDLLQANFHYTSLEKQRNIVLCLSKAQSLIDKRKEQIEACEELIKSQFIEMFGEYFRNNINACQLKDICNFIDYRGKTPEKSDIGIPLITAKNVKSNAFSVEPREFIPKENYDAVMVRGFPRINDVLFTTEAPLGNVCRIPNIYEKFCVGQRLITIQPNEDILTPEYVERALLSEKFQNEMWKRSSGSTVKGIRSKELVLLTIPVPPIEQQKQFTRFIEQVDKLKFEMQESLIELENNFNSLMQRAFKGELF